MNLWLRNPIKMLKFTFWSWVTEFSLPFTDLPEIGFDED